MTNHEDNPIISVEIVPTKQGVNVLLGQVPYGKEIQIDIPDKGGSIRLKIIASLITEDGQRVRVIGALRRPINPRNQ